MLAAVAYLLAAIAVFAPALPDLTASFPGGLVAAVDGWQNAWHLWWAQRALASGQNPLFTPLLYYKARRVALSLDGRALDTWEVPAQPDSASVTLIILLSPGEHTLGRTHLPRLRRPIRVP